MALEIVRRADISLSLVHLTRHRPQRPWSSKTEASAFEVLKEILQAGKIVTGRGFVKGKQPVVCFTEGQPRPRYEFYGIAISKSSGFGSGARPVIYLSDAKAGWMPSDQRWRHVRFQHGRIDFTHEREWRCPNDVDLSQIGFYVIVWSKSEANEVAQLNTPVKNCILGVLPMEHLSDML